MEETKKRIEQIQNQGFQLKTELILGQIAENYKNIALYAGLLILVFSFFLLSVTFLGLASYFGIENVLEMMKPENLKPENFSKEFILNYTICSIVFSALISPFSAGFIKMAYCADTDQEFTTASMFDYYSPKYFKELFLATLVITLFNTLVSSSLELVGLPVLGILVTILVSFFTMLTVPLIIFGNLNAFEAIKSSATIILKQPSTIAVIVTVSMVVALFGLVIFFIGFIFTIPFIYSMYYILYKEVIGFGVEKNKVG